MREGLHGPERILIDPSSDGPDTALDWCAPSPDGRLLAYGLSEGGTEKSTLSVRDVATGVDLEDVIPETRACSLAFLPQATGFLYTRYPEPGSVPKGEENFHRHVFEHTIGSDFRNDPRIFGESRAPEDWPSILLSPNGRWLLILVSCGWTRTDVYVVDRRNGEFRTVLEGEEVLADAVVLDERILLRTNRGAPRFRIVEVDPALPSSAWREIVPEGEEVIQEFAVVGESVLVHSTLEASSRLHVFPARGGRGRSISLPALGTIGGLTGEPYGDEAFFGFSSFTTPPLVYRLPLPEGAPEVWGRIDAPVEPERYTVSLAKTHSRDETEISFFLVQRKDRPRDGRGAALLTGYGGFGVSLTPAFQRTLLLFLDAGGLYAVSHLRGGGEYGEDWHRAGMLEKKPRVFEDFLSVAECLIQEGYADPDRLGIIGGSNGGLLVAGALTMRPDLFAAVVCQVPLTDMVRYHRFRLGRLWIPEYGSPEDREAFQVLLGYSPYHCVVDGTSYPPILLTTGEGDSRVDPMHARKMAARLQAAANSWVLLRVEARAGHGQGKPLSKVVEEATDIWSFLFMTLDLSPPA